MAFLTFRGGVHPYDGKELSKEKPVREYCESPQQGQKDPLLLLLQEYGNANRPRVHFPAEH